MRLISAVLILGLFGCAPMPADVNLQDDTDTDFIEDTGDTGSTVPDGPACDAGSADLDTIHFARPDIDFCATRMLPNATQARDEGYCADGWHVCTESEFKARNDDAYVDDIEGMSLIWGTMVPSNPDKGNCSMQHGLGEDGHLHIAWIHDDGVRYDLRDTDNDGVKDTNVTLGGCDDRDEYKGDYGRTGSATHGSDNDSTITGVLCCY